MRERAYRVRGARIDGLDTDIPGISREEIRRVLSAKELEAWYRWCGGGMTCGAYGVYPWDFEAFLEGRANLD